MAENSPRQDITCRRCDWRQVPTGHNILTASLPCLIDMRERLPWPHLTRAHQWHSPVQSRTFFGNGKGNARIPCNRLQELKRAGDRGIWSPDYETIMTHQTGAVIFRFANDMDDVYPQASGHTQRSGGASRRDTYIPPPTSFPHTRPRRSQGSDSAYGDSLSTTTEWTPETPEFASPMISPQTRSTRSRSQARGPPEPYATQGTGRSA